ncbi:M20/M25/M40 family metallo-hydrolase [Candidatus Bipolaricaulota bacterium]|nr:M20/M25/M40 family metallo-hydrolase [Candidatus Bipolaricaulota bacterium]
MNERLVNTLCEMVRIDSESGNEERFISHVQKMLQDELNADCSIDAHGNLIARVPEKDSSGAEPIFLGAHADTVKPGIGIEPVVEDGVIRSKGETILGADDKAGLAAIIEAVRTAARRPVVDIVVTRGEEIGLVGAKHLDLSLLTAKRGFIVDSDDPATIILGGPTHAALDIEIVGKAAHAAMPEDGVSAIRVAAHAITQFEEGKLDSETVANVGTIKGGMIRNGVPERVTLKAECRSLNDEKCRIQAEKMKKAFEDAAAKAGATANIDLRLEYAASKVEENTAIVELGKKAIEKAGLQPGTRVILGGTDALVLSGRGVDAVVLGYGGKAAHSTDEHIVIKEFEKVTEILRNIVELAADGG